MEQIRIAIKQMINISDAELDQFLGQCLQKKFQRKEIVSLPGVVPNEIFFINSGLFRVMEILRS
jgi:hypothetical protein